MKKSYTVDSRTYEVVHALLAFIWTSGYRYTNPQIVLEDECEFYLIHMERFQ